MFFQNTLDNLYEHLKDFICKKLNSEYETDVPKEDRSCGIIYCRTREQTEVLSHKLNMLGVKSMCYHAGLKNSTRLECQESWQNGDYPVICATVSFGMGVDKATVRLVFFKDVFYRNNNIVDLGLLYIGVSQKIPLRSIRNRGGLVEMANHRIVESTIIGRIVKRWNSF